MRRHRTFRPAGMFLAGLAIATPQAAGAAERNIRPGFIEGGIRHTSYDGVSNDLLTAGLGASGLQGAAPTFADPVNPTTDELRKLAIYNNYRALVDTTPGGGFSVFFGPNVDALGNDTGTEGFIAGDEFVAYMRSGIGGRVVGMVQIPESFDPAAPCMITAPSSGSRGIYGAIGTAGEWGLKNGCAVVYTDKGTGTGAHNLAEDTVQLIDGRLANARSAGRDAHFRALLPRRLRERFNTALPNRFAFKHAHSQQNPERDWGRNVLQSIRLGFYVLNDLFGKLDRHGRRRVTITPDNTIVIASSVSNGGGASVRAAEQDHSGLIDAVVVSEPNVNPAVDRSFAIQQGDHTPITEHSRSLIDYTTALTVYQGCANGAPDNVAAPANLAAGKADAICGALAAKGLVTGADTAERAADAQRILNEEFAVQPEQNSVQPLQYAINVPQAIAITYANAYGRFSVLRDLCGFSFGATTTAGEPAPLPAADEAALFSTSSGIPPTGGVNAIYDNAVGGPTEMAAAVSPSSGAPDYALDGFLCLRTLASGRDAVSGDRVSGLTRLKAWRIAHGVRRIRASGGLDGRPAIIVTGRSDAVLPINHTSRPYFGLNRRVEGDESGLHYYEVLNAHHLDALNGLPGLNARFVPLHVYYNQALDLMLAHLRDGEPLPPSQVVRTEPRGTGAPPLAPVNIPDIAPSPGTGDRIVFEDYLVKIPE